MQWPFYRVLAAPKNIGLRSRQTAILSVQVRLLIVGSFAASCTMQGCMMQWPGPCRENRVGRG